VRGPALAAAGLLLALAGLPLAAGSAAAHGDPAPPVTAGLPVVLAVEPATPGLVVTVIDGGARLRLDNGTPGPVDVRPPDGAARVGEPVVPPGGSAAWADPRLAAPTPGWTLPLLVGEAPAAVRGGWSWPPDPDPAPWWALAVAVAAGTFCLGGTAVLHRGDGRPARTAELGVAGVAVAVVAAHIVHVLGAVQVAAQPPSVGGVLAAAGLGPLCWAFGLLGAGLTGAGRSLGPAVCGTAGALAALLTALDTADFARPVLATGLPFELDRVATVVAFGGGAGLLLAGWVALSARPAEPVASPAPAG
jgi:hypothetical protein